MSKKQEKQNPQILDLGIFITLAYYTTPTPAPRLREGE